MKQKKQKAEAQNVVSIDYELLGYTVKTKYKILPLLDEIKHLEKFSDLETLLEPNKDFIDKTKLFFNVVNISTTVTDSSNKTRNLEAIDNDDLKNRIASATFSSYQRKANPSGNF